MDDQERQLWRAVVGRSGQAPPETPADAIRNLERAGATRKEIAQFKRDVAAELGVTVRQVQRMTTTTGRERRGITRHAEQLGQLASKHPRVRTASVSKRRAARMRNQGARLRIKGTQGPSIPGSPGTKRDRTITRHLDGETLDAIRELWEAGDDEAANNLLRGALEDEGYPAWDWDPDADLDFLR
jgi:hypothetical protein